MTTTIATKIPVKIGKDRDYIMQQMSTDMKSFTIQNFVNTKEQEHDINENILKEFLTYICTRIESNFDKYKQLPLYNEKKQSGPKVIKLKTFSAWNLFDEEYGKLNRDKICDENNNNKYSFAKHKSLSSAEWKSGNVDHGKYKEFANEKNTISLQAWRDAYAEIETDQKYILDLLKSKDIAKMKKSDCFHYIGLAGYADKVDQATSIQALRKTLLDYTTENDETENDETENENDETDETDETENE